MTGRTGRNSSHIEVIKAMRRLIAERYPEGGWLPPVREMAVRLGVSNPTYVKALKHMAVEGGVERFPRGYHVTPAWLHCHKVGLIVGTGRDSLFLTTQLDPAFQLFFAAGFHVQIISASSMDKLLEATLIRDIEAVLWLNPPSQASAVIRQIQGAGSPPLALAVAQPWLFDLDVPPGVGLSTFDREKFHQLRAQYLHERGHRRLLYLSDPGGRGSQAAAFRQLGVSLEPKHCLVRVAAIPGKLTRMLRQYQATAILSDGGVVRVAELFAELSALPDESQPELLVDSFAELDRLAGQCPKVKLLHPPWPQREEPSTTAARMLLRHLTLGEPMGTVKT